MQKYVMEFIGTLFLVLAIGLTGNPIAIGGMLALMVYLGGHISGAHYNPAVTVAVWIKGGIEKKHILGYWTSQILGAFSASFLLILFRKPFIPSPSPEFTILPVLIIEILFTFILAIVILTVTSKKMIGNYIYGFAIGLALTIGIFAGGSISGGVYNPAVALGPLILQYIMGSLYLSNAILYIIGPTLGGVLAAVLYRYLNRNSTLR